MIPLKPATPASASRSLDPVDVERISVANSDLVDRAEEHRGRVVGVGQIGGCGHLVVPLSIVGDEPPRRPLPVASLVLPPKLNSGPGK